MATPFVMEALGAQPRDEFDCGVDALNRYLKSQAGQDIRRGVARCFVAIDAGSLAIAGYYTLSACHLLLDKIPSTLAKRLPHYPEVPAARLGRLAIDVRFQGRKLGAALLADAALRALRSEVAVVFLLADAKNEAAAAFYRHHGFASDPQTPLRLFIPLATLAKAAGGG